MNTHATNLLHALIEGLYNAKPTPELHTFQMLAAELKGAMQAQAIDHGQSDPLPTQIVTPTPDADGWVENTGVMPECEIASLRFATGEEAKLSGDDRQPSLWRWRRDKEPQNAPTWTWGAEDHITHYRPA